MPNNNYLYHNAARPCPLCDGTTDCRTNLISGGVSCRRADQYTLPPGWSFRLTDRSGFGVFFQDGRQHEPITDYGKKRVDASRQAKADRKKGEGVIPGGSSAFDRIRADMRPMTMAERTALAAALTLPTGIFDLLAVQFVECDDHNRAAWVFPERDAAGRVIGYTLRYPDGSKRNHGNRGLSIPTAWTATDSSAADRPLFLCEGASDTLALASLGLDAIGRPNNIGGVDHLAELLRRVDPRRQIVVLGENDQKPNGVWAGREGAESTAQALVETLGRPVHVAMPPIGVKDARELICSREADIRAKTVTLAELGAEWVRHCSHAAVAYSPKVVIQSATHITVVNSTSTSPTPPAAPLPSVDWTAADCTPPADDLPPVECNRCPRPRGVLMRNATEGKSRLYWFDCKRLSCEHCGEVKRRQWQATVQDRLQAHGDRTAPTVYLFWCDVEDWPSISRGLRASHSSYFRLETDYGRLLIVSAERPASLRANGLTEVSTQVASDRLCAAIAMVPAIREKMLTYSRDWKMIGEDKSPKWQGWKRISKIATSQRAIWDIFEYHQIDWKAVKHAGVFWSWSAWQWTDSQCARAGGHRRVYDDLVIGEVLPDVDMFADGEDAEVTPDDGEFSTGPPVAAGVWIDW